MNKSAENINKKYGDPVKKQNWAPANTKKEAYIKEHEDIESNGGAGNTERNYNINNSPGKTIIEQTN